MTTEDSCDVLVVGGGPAGSTAATLVARRGHSVVLLEKERFPRYRIGESLLPATVHGIGRLLEVDDELARAGFMIKRGGRFRWGVREDPWNFQFAVSPRLAGPTSYAYQVDRMRFDEILLRNAARHGVDVRERCPVSEVLRDERGRVCGAGYTDPSGVRRVLRARFVVDATGSTGRLWTAAGGRRHYPDFFANVAVFGYFRGGARLPEPDRGSILCAAFAEGWCWYIPLADDLTGVGAVVHRSQAGRIGADRPRALRELIERCDIVADHLGDAERVTEGEHGRVRVRRDYSYSPSRWHADGLLLVGDAACFVDPVFSTGVHLATYGALLAARSINGVLAGEVGEPAALAEFEGRYRREFGAFYEFLTAFYDLQQHESDYFWQARRVTGLGETDLEAFAELVGGVASGDPSLQVTQTRLATAGRDLAHGVAAGAGMTALLRAPVLRAAMAEGNRMQVAGLPQQPLWPGGLVPSADQLSWSAAT
jgi:halogenation protein CepH